MEEQPFSPEQLEGFDAQAFMERAGQVAKQLRKSEAFPALIGALAGGIAGALLAAVVAQRISSHAVSAPSESSTPSSTSTAQKIVGGWSLREIMQLLTVAASLAKQAQAWYQEQKKT